MAKFVDGKDPGKCSMSGKTFLGVPRSKVSSKAGNISKADNRATGTAKIK